MSPSDSSSNDESPDTRLEAAKLAALAEFAAGAGHEINNPLAVISGRAQLLLASETDPDRRRDLATIRQQALRIHEMISDLMHFARPAQPRFEQVAIDPLIREVVGRFESRALAAKVRIDHQPGANDLYVSGDATQLAVALAAIVENALAAVEGPPLEANGAHPPVAPQAPVLDTARPPAEIRISAALQATPQRPARVEISIADNGPGFAADVRRHAFDPFYSGRNAGRGLGMGLAKCWRIVNLHGGRVDLSSRSGHGTIVKVILPAARSAESNIASRPRKTRRQQMGRARTAQRNKKQT